MEPNVEAFDTVVVGAGVEGSSTAYHLAKGGKRTLLLEQFPTHHNKGSSHGLSRATESSFGSNNSFIPLTIEANKIFEELHTECGEQLFVRCGWMTCATKGDFSLSGTEDGLKKYNFPYERFDAKEQRRRFPNLLVPDDFEFIYDKSGGVLKADKILHAFQSQFERYGGILKDNEGLTDLEMGETISVKTSKGVYKANSVVLTLGPWAVKFLPRIGINLPLEAEEAIVSYWRDNSGEDFSIDNFPVFYTMALGEEGWLGCIPAYEYPGLVKISTSTGTLIDPDNRIVREKDEVKTKVQRIISKHFPTLSREPSQIESCITTNTPDSNYVLDVHPVWRNVVIGTGFSGHGFRLSPVIGKILSQLASGEQPSYDITQFRMDRFFKNNI